MSPRPVHARVLVDEPGDAARWFVDHLGFEVLVGDLDGSGPYVELVRDGVPLGFYSVGLMDALLLDDVVSPVGDAVMVVVPVDDVDTAATRLRRAGASLRRGPEDRPDWFLRTAQLRTPTGVLLELNAPLATTT